MHNRIRARELVKQLSPAEKDALTGLLTGEGMIGLARRRSISRSEAVEIRGAMKRKLGVGRDAEAVRIGLTAGID